MGDKHQEKIRGWTARPHCRHDDPAGADRCLMPPCPVLRTPQSMQIHRVHDSSGWNREEKARLREPYLALLPTPPAVFWCRLFSC